MSNIDELMVKAGADVLRKQRGWVTGRANDAVRDILAAALAAAPDTDRIGELERRVAQLASDMAGLRAEYSMHVMVPLDEYDRLACGVDPFAIPLPEAPPTTRLTDDWCYGCGGCGCTGTEAFADCDGACVRCGTLEEEDGMVAVHGRIVEAGPIPNQKYPIAFRPDGWDGDVVFWIAEDQVRTIGLAAPAERAGVELNAITDRVRAEELYEYPEGDWEKGFNRGIKRSINRIAAYWTAQGAAQGEGS